MNDKAPSLPVFLTFAGISPFAGLAGAAFWFQQDIALLQTMALWLLLYAAVISSFVAGIRWGLALSGDASDQGQIFVTSVLPPLVSWVCAGLYFRFAEAHIFLAMAVLFVALYAWDRASAELPDWFKALRIWPTLGAGLSLCAVYFLLR